MSPKVLVVAINAGGSIVISVTAPIPVYGGFGVIGRRLEIVEQAPKQFLGECRR